jgi:hypothetical protein
MCSPSQPDTSRQQAEAQREAAIQEQHYQEQLKLQQDEWDRQRQDSEARYQQQLKVAQDEIERQKGIQQKAADDAEALRQQQIKQQEDVNRRGRDYASGRDTAISGAVDQINQGYAGFNDAYYQDFAQKFLDANRGDVDTSYERGTRTMKYKLADARNLNSSAAADAFGELDKDHLSGVAKVANTASDKANALKQQINAQRSAAINSVYGLGNMATPDFQNDEDEASALSRIGNAVKGVATTYAPPTPTSYAPSYA